MVNLTFYLVRMQKLMVCRCKGTAFLSSLFSFHMEKFTCRNLAYLVGKQRERYKGQMAHYGKMTFDMQKSGLKQHFFLAKTASNSLFCLRKQSHLLAVVIGNTCASFECIFFLFMLRFTEERALVCGRACSCERKSVLL